MRTRTKFAAVLVALFVLVTTFRTVSGGPVSDEDETTADETSA